MMRFRQVPVWWQAARPKTLFAAICPVLMGGAISFRAGSFAVFDFFVVLVTAVLIQISTNLANDLIDARKGTDTDDRVGPTRAVQSGLLSESQVSKALLTLLVASLLLGIYLVSVGGLPILVIGVAALLCTIWYSAGPAALSYSGLADIFVLVFFGPVAVAGTVLIMLGVWSRDALIVGLAPGLFSVAILVANNLRDYWTDKAVNKKTLVVRFGLPFGRLEYTFCVLAAVIAPVIFSDLMRVASLVAGLTILFAVPLIMSVWKANSAKDFLPMLPKTAQLLVVYGILFSVGLFV